MGRLSVAALVSASLLVAALPAAAQPAPGATAESEERRTRLFKEGKAAADAGQWAEAAARFRQVVALRSAPRALIALGVAEDHLGHLVAAHAAYRQAREEAADAALTDDLKTANTALEAIRPRIPRLVFSPRDALAGAAVELDGQPARPEDGVLLVDPGEHTLYASVPGKGTFRTALSLKEGEQREVAVLFGAASAPSSTGTARPGPDRPGGGFVRPPTGAVVLGAAGIVLAGVGAALYGAGSGDYAAAEGLCPTLACPKAVADRGNAARTQMIAGDVLLIAGAAAVAGAAIHWVVSATSKKAPATSVFVSPRATGIDVGARF